MQIATGEIDDPAVTDDGKNAAAVALGRMGGKARAAGMTAKKRSEIAKMCKIRKTRRKPPGVKPGRFSCDCSTVV